MIDFKELKKQLKDIEKLSEENLDVNSWESDLKVWIKYQKVTDPEDIFTASVLTSCGEPRKIIQDLEENNYEDDSDIEEDSDSDSDEESDEK